MPVSQVKAAEAVPSAESVGADALRKYISYTTYAGNPTNNVTPHHIGQMCLDTSGSNFYIAVGAAAANWKAMTS